MEINQFKSNVMVLAIWSVYIYWHVSKSLMIYSLKLILLTVALGVELLSVWQVTQYSLSQKSPYLKEINTFIVFIYLIFFLAKWNFTYKTSSCLPWEREREMEVWIFLESIFAKKCLFPLCVETFWDTPYSCIYIFF